MFRALGFLGGKDDLLKGFSTSESSGTLAFYSFVDKDIIVRGTTLDVEHRVTIAHELTHVLQDQHFDLTKLEKAADASETGDSSALQALVEGDAVRIEDDYRKQLSTADQSEYAREVAAESDRVDTETASTPKIVNLLLGAPYQFGPSTIRVLLESGGNDAVNNALTGPVPSTEVFSQAGDVDPPVPVDARPGSGRRRQGRPGVVRAVRDVPHPGHADRPGPGTGSVRLRRRRPGHHLPEQRDHLLPGRRARTTRRAASRSSTR